ncbi:MAG TPA: hypothetical protein VFT20_07435 [Candidatus Limnocylindrales bacterium]|nr:hypothetical protein [Candidatus Limnocylindrales bacterium]
MPEGTARRGGASPSVGPARHELPAVDDAALAAARHLDRLVAAAAASGYGRWERYLLPLAEPLRDGGLREVRAAALRARAAYGPKDSVRDALPSDVTEPFLEAVDRLLKILARRDAFADR